MADGDSTDYDSLPSPPIRATTSSRGGKATRRYGRKAARVLPRSPPPQKGAKASAARGGGGRGKTGKRTERGESSASDVEEGRGEVGKVKRVKGNAVKGKSRAKEDKEEADGESGAEEGVGEGKRKTAKEDKQGKRPTAATASHELPPPPAQDAGFPPTTEKPPSSRAPKRPRDAPLPQPAEQPAAPVPPTPPRRPSQQQRKTHPAVLEAQAQDDPWANMTPRSRARALGDKSNRPSVASPSGGAGGGRPSQGRPSLPLSPGGRTVDSPRSRTQSRRGSLALPPSPFGVFRDPAPPSLSLPVNQRNAAPSYPSLPPPTLTDLPPRRRPFLRTASASLSAPPSAPPSVEPLPPVSARSPLSLPRSPGPSSATQSRLPRAARAFSLPRSAPPSSLLAVPGAPPTGQVPRLPPPWSLAAPPTSSPASTAPAGVEGQVGEGEGAEPQPVFRFTTTQFADLPSLSLSSTRPSHDGGEKANREGGRADDSALVGMESSFMLETFEGSGVFEDETVTMEEQEEEMETSGDGTMEGQEEEEDEGDVTIRAIEVDEKEEEEGTTGEATGSAVKPQLFDTTAQMAADEEEVVGTAVISDDEGETTVMPVDDLEPNVSFATASSPSSAAFSSPPATGKILGPHPPPLAYSASFMPPRRPRPPISPNLPSGPPSDEDDLAYYLRTTGTFSSEDDLPPSPFEELDSSAEEDRLAEREVGRAVKATSGQREKRIEASEEARRVREARRAVKWLRIGEGKDGRRKGWRRVVLAPRAARGAGWNKVEGVVDDGYEADQGEVEGEEGDEEDELAMSFG